MKKIWSTLLLGIIAIAALTGCGKNQSESSSEPDITTETIINIDREGKELIPDKNSGQYETINTVYGVSFDIPSGLLNTDYVLNPNTLNSETHICYAIEKDPDYNYIDIDYSTPVLFKSPDLFCYVNEGNTLCYVAKMKSGESESIWGIESLDGMSPFLNNFSINGINNLVAEDNDNFSYDLTDSGIYSCCMDISFSDPSNSTLYGYLKILETADSQYCYIYGTSSEETLDKSHLLNSFVIDNSNFNQDILLSDYETADQVFDFGGKKITIPLSSLFKIDLNNTHAVYDGTFYDNSLSYNEYYDVALGYEYYKLPFSDLEPEELLCWSDVLSFDNTKRAEITDNNGNIWVKTVSDQRLDSDGSFHGYYLCFYTYRQGKSAYVFSLIYKPSGVDFESLFEQELKSVKIEKGESNRKSTNTEYINYMTVLYHHYSDLSLSYYFFTDEEKNRITNVFNNILYNMPESLQQLYPEWNDFYEEGKKKKSKKKNKKSSNPTTMQSQTVQIDK